MPTGTQHIIDQYLRAAVRAEIAGDMEIAQAFFDLAAAYQEMEPMTNA